MAKLVLDSELSRRSLDEWAERVNGTTILNSAEASSSREAGSCLTLLPRAVDLLVELRAETRSADTEWVISCSGVTLLPRPGRSESRILPTKCRGLACGRRFLGVGCTSFLLSSLSTPLSCMAKLSSRLGNAPWTLPPPPPPRLVGVSGQLRDRRYQFLYGSRWPGVARGPIPFRCLPMSRCSMDAL